MIQVSTVIITFNEEENIERCLQSVLPVSDEVIIVDSFSSDRTLEICRQYPVRIHQQEFREFSQQKNLGTSLARHDYILSLDADESLSEDLGRSIQQVKKSWKCDGYIMKRMNNYCGKWIRHGAWYPDRQLRLYDRRKGSWGGIRPHDKVIMDEGSLTCEVSGDLMHYTIKTGQDHDRIIEKYAMMRAKYLFDKRKRPTFYHLYVKPAGKFLIDYFVKLGFLDGLPGLTIARKSAYAYHLRYVKLADLYRSDRT